MNAQSAGNFGFRRCRSSLLVAVGYAALLVASGPAFAQIEPSLGTAATYAVASSTFTNANTPPQSIVNGDICYTTGPGATPPVTQVGAVAVPCPPQVGLDESAAKAILLGQPCTFLGAGAIALDALIIGANPPGTIPPGCYFNGGAMNVTANTTVTLSGAGAYIFRPGGALNTQANSLVTLANGACANDVFWAPVAATTLGANAALSPTPTFVGTIIDDAGITIGHFANLTGRALAAAGTVTTDAVTITVPTCAALAGPSVNNGVPTLSEWALILLATLLAGAGVLAIRGRTI